MDETDHALGEVMTELIGSIAAFLTTSCFVLQVWHIVKTRQTAGISLAMYVVFGAGVLLWLTYGLLLGSGPIIISNIITIVLVGMIIAMKLKYR
jgi:MtN3 and saliva related transmembrane protein